MAVLRAPAAAQPLQPHRGARHGDGDLRVGVHARSGSLRICGAGDARRWRAGGGDCGSARVARRGAAPGAFSPSALFSRLPRTRVATGASLVDLAPLHSVHCLRTRSRAVSHPPPRRYHRRVATSSERVARKFGSTFSPSAASSTKQRKSRSVRPPRSGRRRRSSLCSFSGLTPRASRRRRSVRSPLEETACI